MAAPNETPKAQAPNGPRKVTVYGPEGATLRVRPVDAREMVERSGYSLTPPGATDAPRAEAVLKSEVAPGVQMPRDLEPPPGGKKKQLNPPPAPGATT